MADQLRRNLHTDLIRRLGAEHGTFIDGFLAALSDSFLESAGSATIAEYTRQALRIPDDIPAFVDVRSDDGEGLIVTIIAPDYPSEFAAITGVLAAAGMDIESGEVYTVERRGGARLTYRELRRMRSLGSAPPAIADERVIVDRFRGRLTLSDDPAAWAQRVRARLVEITGAYLDARAAAPEDAVTEVKRQVANEVAEALSRRPAPMEGLLLPVDVELSEEQDSTIIVVRAQDTPFFLYSVSTALWLNEVSIRSVSINTIGDRLEDRFEVEHRRGERVTDPDRAGRLRLSIAFTKQFTSFLPNAPDPHRALLRFESLLADALSSSGAPAGPGFASLSNPEYMRDLARLLGTSDFLWEDFIRGQFESLTPLLQATEPTSLPETDVLEALRAGVMAAEDQAGRRDALNSFKDREIYRIDLDHIIHQDLDFFFLSRRLTALAEAVLEVALELAGRQVRARHGVPRSAGGLEASFAAFGLGKLGGAALGYASDIELLFVYSDDGESDGPEPLRNSAYFEQLFREAVGLIETKREGIFRIDLRLRPHGSAGPVACSLENFIGYYAPTGAAHSFERLALVRLRAVAGDRDFGRRVERLRDELIYNRKAIDLARLKELREKQLAEKVSGEGFNAKFSPGALVDLEYTVQILQIVHGESRPLLRTPRIHEALRGLSETGAIGADEADRLVRAYRFFRTVINALRMLRGNASDLLLPPFGSIEYQHVARRAGYRSGETMSAVEKLRLDLETWSATVRVFVERQLGRRIGKDLTVAGIADVVLDPENDPSEFEGFLEASGLTRPSVSFAAIRSLAAAGRDRETVAGVFVLAWDLIRSSPDPDSTLVTWDRYVAASPEPGAHFASLLRQPRRLEFLVGIFSRSRFLSEVLIRNPEMLDWVTDPARVSKRRPYEKLVEELTEIDRRCHEPESWLRELRDFRTRETLRIGTRDVCLKRPIEGIVGELSDLAAVCCRVSLQRIARDLEPRDPERILSAFGLFAFGKLGGWELNYSSDIDLLGVYAPLPTLSESENGRLFSDLITRLRAMLSDRTEDGHVYRVDLRLRPYGSAGPAAQAMSAVETYYRQAASIWEFQALLKLGFVAGSRSIRDRMTRLVEESVRKRRDMPMVFENIRRLRAMAASRTPPGAIDVKDGIGGIRDIEFLAQGLQLIYAEEIPSLLSGNTFQALELLGTHRLLPLAVTAELAEAYRFLRRIEHLLQLYEDRQTHIIPGDPAVREALARRLDEAPDSFQDHVESTMKRVRELFETFLQAEDQELRYRPGNAK